MKNTHLPPEPESIVSAIYKRAEEITRKVVANPYRPEESLTYKLDRILTSRLWGIPVLLFLLGIAFWITIVGANYPSDLLLQLFQKGEVRFTLLLNWFKFPLFFQGMLILGIYRTLAWVIAVMLPPMAIFFPLFTLLEDLGYLPRVAFILDHLFQRAATNGKQALTMAMGFGCNAAGILACRIIESPRERLTALLTNNFMPCNGRFPMLIVMAGVISGLAFNGQVYSIIPTIAVLGGISVGVIATFSVSKILTVTVLRGNPSFFALELPPYRKPQLGQVLYRSFMDRTLFVLSRAMIVAAPAGLVIWFLANSTIGNLTLINHLIGWLEPFGKIIGLDGVILLAFILGLPANEIIIPIMLMMYLQAGAMLPLEGIASLQELLVANGWTLLTVLNFSIFTVLHWPCATTLLTIKKETQSWYWTILSAAIPTILGLLVCFCTSIIGKIVI